MTPYKKLFEAQSDIDVDDYIEKVEEKQPAFVSVSLNEVDRKKFVKMHSSKRYLWKFDVHEIETSSEKQKSDDKIKKLKRDGWKVFMDDYNVDQRALVFYKRK